MNSIYKDENILKKEKENMKNLIYNYKDKIEFKYKKFNEPKSPLENKYISKYLSKPFGVINQNNQTPKIRLNRTNFNVKCNIPNNISFLDKNKLNNSSRHQNNKTNLSNHFLFESKDNNYLSPKNNNNNKALLHSMSYSSFPKTIREKMLLGNLSQKYQKRIYNISFIQNNDNNINKEVHKLKESNSENHFKIQQKFFYRNSSQKNIFNKSFQNFNKTTKHQYLKNNSISFGAIPLKELTPKISDKEGNLETNLRKIHGIDLKIEKLLKKNIKKDDEKDNEIKEKDSKKENQRQKLAQFYDNLPSLIIKNNIDKYMNKPCKQSIIKEFGQNFHSNSPQTSTINEKKKKELDKIIKKNPIIRYIFLQKILDSLVHKIKLIGDHKEELVINSNETIKLNEEIQDFITYGYEFIPEDFLMKKNINSPKDFLEDEDFIKIILNTKSSLDNSLNTNSKEFSQLKVELDMITDTRVIVSSKKLQNKSYMNLMHKFLELQIKNDKKTKKSRFLYKKININKMAINKVDDNNNIVNRSIDYIHSKNSNNKSYLDKSINTNMKPKIKIDKEENKNKNILSQLMNVLYDDINNLDDIIKRERRKNEKRNIIKSKEMFWHRVLNKKNSNEIIYYINKRKRKIKSGSKKNTENNNKLYEKYKFEKSEKSKKRRIKSGKKYIEKNEENDSENDYKTNIVSNEKIKSTYNIFNKNQNNKRKTPNKKKKIINLMKKPDIKPILEKTLKDNKIIEPKKENKKNIIIKKYKRKIPNIKPPKNEEEKKEQNDTSKEKRNDSYYTNLNPEEIINEKKTTIKEEENKEIKKEVKKEVRKKIVPSLFKNSSYKDYLINYYNEINSKENHAILSKILESEYKKNNEKKQKSKKSILNSLIYKNNNEKKSNNNTKENNDKDTKKESKGFFTNMKLNSLEDIEKKKFEILYKFKHDIKYKINIGEMSSIEMENFEAFQEKIFNLKDKFTSSDYDSYIKELEIIFQSFQQEIADNANKKIDEDRINKYLKQYQEDYNDKNYYKDIQRNFLCKVINFSQVNHMNMLNNTEDIVK